MRISDWSSDVCSSDLRALQLFKDIRTRDLTTQNPDYSAAVASFLNGGGGVLLVGTWLVQDFDAASRNPNSAIHNGHAVFPHPPPFQRNVTFAAGTHGVFQPHPQRPPATRSANGRDSES